MTSIRGEKRRRRGRPEIPSPEPRRCHTCGRTGPPNGFRCRNKRWVCFSTAACMERVFNPPPPDPSRPVGGTFTIAGHTFPYDASAADIQAALNNAGFQPIGYIGEDGIK